MITLRSVALFVLAAVLEIGGAWLIWQAVREHRGIGWAGAGVVAPARKSRVQRRIRGDAVGVQR